MPNERPYFMTNKQWYYFDDEALGDANDRGVKLTELGRSLPDVVASYDEYYDAKSNDDLRACGE